MSDHPGGTPDQRVIPLPPALAGRWALLVLKLPARRRRNAVPRLLVMGPDGIDPIAEAFPTRVGWSNVHCAVCFIPQRADRVELQVLGDAGAVSRTSLRALPLSRASIAAFVILRHPYRFVQALGGGRSGLVRRMRGLLAILTSRLNRTPGYETWIELFDTWSDDDIAHLLSSPGRAHWPRASALVFCDQAETSDAAQATLASLRSQIIPIAAHVVHSSSSPPVVGPDDYVLLLQAGEVLARHGTAVLLDTAASQGRPALLFADEDRVAPSGRRHAPLFKPQAGYPLMVSGTLTRGAWLVRGDVMTAATPGLSWAEAVRLEAWLRADEVASGSVSHRVPFVLTHRRDDAEAAPAEALADVITAHLARTHRVARVDAARLPIRVTPALPPAVQPRVTLIVPSACRTPHVARCLGSLLQRTRYAAIDMVIVVTQNQPLDEVQAQVLQSVLADKRARVIIRPADEFNYSAANNFAADVAEGAFLCLVNDDIEPISEDWLDLMLGHFADPRVGVVGAKLYYPDATVQHGGLLIGASGLADHMNRFLARGEPGYASRAILNQDVSGVTGACLLIRRAVFDAVGGLDEAYPIAYNDVDFCLRVREAGWSIVFSADAELYHYESLSLGHHFAGPRANREAEEIDRMRRRWTAVIHDDPFHNPNLSQRRGCEWDPAYPPRVAKPGSRYGHTG